MDTPERGPELGAEGYRVKPFRRRRLLEVVGRALAKRD
jgi:hypothetical protein